MRILPRDEECEKRVLGTILSERDTIYELKKDIINMSTMAQAARYGNGIHFKYQQKNWVIKEAHIPNYNLSVSDVKSFF